MSNLLKIQVLFVQFLSVSFLYPQNLKNHRADELAEQALLALDRAPLILCIFFAVDCCRIAPLFMSKDHK